MRHHKSRLRLLLMTEDGWQVIIGWGLLMGLMVGVAIESRNAYRLAVEGTDAVANIVDLDTYSTGEGVDFVVQYAFLVDGHWVMRTSRVSRTFFASLEEEGRLPVRYWTVDPAVAEIEPAITWLTLERPLPLWIGLCIFMAFYVHSACAKVAQIYWLSRYGVPVQSKVFGHEEISGEGQSYWRAKWIGPNGQTGKTSAQPAEKLPQIGSQITILTDPSGKRPSLWEDDI